MTVNTAPNTTTVRPSRSLAKGAIVRPARADMHRQYAPRQRSGRPADDARRAIWAIPDCGGTNEPHQRARASLCAGEPGAPEEAVPMIMELGGLRDICGMILAS